MNPECFSHFPGYTKQRYEDWLKATSESLEDRPPGFAELLKVLQTIDKKCPENTDPFLHTKALIVINKLSTDQPGIDKDEIHAIKKELEKEKQKLTNS